MNRLATVDLLRAVLADHPGVDLAVLFGSEARGTSRSDSDVDLLVSGVDRHGLRALEAAASRALGRAGLRKRPATMAHAARDLQAMQSSPC